MENILKKYKCPHCKSKELVVVSKGEVACYDCDFIGELEEFEKIKKRYKLR